MNNKAMAMEELVKIIIAVFVLLVIITVFYILFKPTINGILGIRDEGAKGGTVIDDLFKAFGKKCEDGTIECNPVTNTKRICKDQEWVTQDEACD